LRVGKAPDVEKSKEQAAFLSAEFTNYFEPLATMLTNFAQQRRFEILLRTRRQRLIKRF